VREYLRAIGDSGQTPSFYGLQGFIEAKVIVEAVRRAPTPLTRQGLVTALESLGELDVGGMTVKFTPKSREGARFVDLTVVGSEGQLRR
jgi:ABC-type branched-subunit amino acid transport system substrate-binding protein